MSESLPALENDRSEVVRQITRLGDFRPGSILGVMGRCSKPNCHCAQAGDPGHGPNFRLTAKVKGKTAAETLSSSAAVPLTANDPLTFNGAPCTPVLTNTQAGYPPGLRLNSKRFMPRFGFAYKPFNSDNTVVRGSIGAYEAATMGSVFYSLTGTLQAYTRTFLNSLGPNGQPLFVWPETSTGGAFKET